MGCTGAAVPALRRWLRHCIASATAHPPGDPGRYPARTSCFIFRRRMKSNRKLLTWLLVSALLVGVAVLMISQKANPLLELKIENIDTISFASSGQFASVGSPKSIELPSAEYRRIIETLRATRVDRSPYKWQVAGKMNILTSNGEVTLLDFYETGAAEGAFRIGDTYYRFHGDPRSLTSSATGNAG